MGSTRQVPPQPTQKASPTLWGPGTRGAREILCAFEVSLLIHPGPVCLSALEAEGEGRGRRKWHHASTQGWMLCWRSSVFISCDPKDSSENMMFKQKPFFCDDF